jgi:CDP-diacylglycerol--serine O-phosphatidyltransferase
MPWVAFAITVYAGLSMVSSAPFYSGKKFQIGSSVPFWVLIVAVIAIFVVSSDPPIALFTIGCCYALSGYVYWIWRWFKGEPNPAKPLPAVKADAPLP